MRILLLANNIVGLEIAQYLKKRKENIVGLGIHEEDKQKFTNEIINTLDLPEKFIFRADSLRDKKTLQKIKSLKPDIVIAAFWGYILKPDFLKIPKKGCINFHPGYLPYNRGMNPNVWPIVESTPAGVTLHYIDDGIDTGDIIARKKVKVNPWDTAESIYEKTLLDIVLLFKEVWPKIRSSENDRIKQNLLKDSPTFHWAKDINTLDEIKLTNFYNGEDLINRLRSRSYGDRYYSYFIKDGQRIYVRLELKKGEKTDENLYQKSIIEKLNLLKFSAIPLALEIRNNENKNVGLLEAFIASYVNDKKLIKLLGKWRQESEKYFPSQFKVTFDGTKAWAKNKLILEDDRFLFLLRDKENKIIGHMGLYRFDYKNRVCEIDNVLRGEGAIPGFMTFALKRLIDWSFNEFNLSKLNLRVFADNEKAINLYKRCGFKKVKLIPLRKEVVKNLISWIEDENLPLSQSERQYVLMSYAKK